MGHTITIEGRTFEVPQHEWGRIHVDRLHKCPWNYKTEDEGLQQKLGRSIIRHGELQNLVVRTVEGLDGFELVDGNHRPEDYRKAGILTPMCCNVGPVSDDVAYEMSVALNEFGFPPDLARKARMVSVMLEREGETPVTLSGRLPYSPTEIEAFRDASRFDWDTFQPPSGATVRGTSGRPLETDVETLHRLVGYDTAVERKSVSKVVQDLQESGRLKGKVLDFGCGHDPHTFERFDPVTAPNYGLLMRKWDTVLCTYVFNVLPLEHMRVSTLLILLGLLAPGGRVIVTILTGKQGWTSHGFQSGWTHKEWRSFFKRFCHVETLSRSKSVQYQLTPIRHA